MSADTFAELLAERQVVIVCGTGGVGKTTTAAATALAAAEAGRRAVVVTIDPAKRLADALGIAEPPGVGASRWWREKGGSRCDCVAAD